MDRAIIDDNAEIKDSIIGRHTTIESSKTEPTRIDSMSVIADDVTIAKGSELSQTKIYPHMHISKGNYRGIVLST
jgi:NDP-sugar pyrophosphorylase family protein